MRTTGASLGRDSFEFSELFTDRDTESHAFAAALAAHRRRLDDQTGAEHPPQGRNLLVFHGIGGLGKSELSKRLERWVRGVLDPAAGWGPPPETAVAAVARIDLAPTQGHIDGAELLARLRMQLGPLKRSWPLFDLAFAAYWASARPSEPLPWVSDGAGDEFARSTFEVIGAVAEDHVFAEGGVQLGGLQSPALFATLGAQLFRGLVTVVSARLRARFGEPVPDGYDELFRRCASEPARDDPRPDLLAELAHLLTVEIDAVAQPVPLVVVFLDTFERLDNDVRRQAESLLNRVVWVMDNVLFVVTGRNRLDWWELTGRSLPYRGPGVWPLLVHGVDDEPRQHALEHLSDHDRRILLNRAIAELGLEVPDDVVEAIAEASGGLPEYLRLAAFAALARMRNGEPVTIDAVAGTLPELVALLLEDLPNDDARRAVRAAALFARPTVPLMAAAAGVTEGAATQAISRALFDAVDEATGEYAMHDKVRAAIRDEPATTSGGWTNADWIATGERALAHLRARYEDSRERYLEAARARDAITAAAVAVETLRATALAVSVVCATEARPAATTGVGYVDWLTEALVKGPSVAGLQQYLPVESRTAYGTEILDFVRAKTTALELDDRLELLRELWQSHGAMSWIAGRHLGYEQLNACRWDDSVASFDALMAERPDNAFVRYQRALALARAERYRQLLDALPELDPSRHEAVHARVAFAKGKARRYLAWTSQLVIDGPRSGALKDGLENEGIDARWRPLLGAPLEPGALRELRMRADAAGHDTAARDAVFSEAFTTGRIDDVELRWLIAVDRARTDGVMGFREATLRAAFAYLHDDLDALRALRTEIHERGRPRGAFWTPLRFLFDAVELPLDDEPGVEWIGSLDRARHRWARRWAAWRERVRGAD